MNTTDYWIPHETEGWAKYTGTDPPPDTAVRGEPEIAPVIAHGNLAKLRHLNEATILTALRQRYQQSQIYTFTDTVLLAINPYQSLPLY